MGFFNRRKKITIDEYKSRAYQSIRTYLGECESLTELVNAKHTYSIRFTFNLSKESLEIEAIPENMNEYAPFKLTIDEEILTDVPYPLPQLSGIYLTLLEEYLKTYHFTTHMTSDELTNDMRTCILVLSC